MIAYFCSEFALSGLPTFAGGLGILATDYLREADHQNFPAVGVSLMYGGSRPDLEIVKDKNGKALLLSLPIEGHEVYFQAYRIFLGKTPLYLLDTHVAANTQIDQDITNILYVPNKETRLKQQILLGIGGFKLLQALELNPEIYHLNEGHSAFLTFEIIAQAMQKNHLDFEQAKLEAKKQVVFTNHTLVAAGDEIYSTDLLSLMLEKYFESIGVPGAELTRLGLVQESDDFSMTMLALRMAKKTSAVSSLHAKKAAEIWTDHAMTAITNGIFIPGWDQIKENVSVPGTFLKQHRQLKKILQAEIIKFRPDWPDEYLLLGWARRFVEYKRPMAIFENLKRFVEITQNTKHPVKVVFAGNAPLDDPRGQALLAKLKEICDQNPDSALYLPDYGLNLAKLLTAGCDVWLNTPIVGFEACGTSGMKAALNGVLPCSSKDGWVGEADLSGKGWALDNYTLPENLLTTLEKEIVPMYFENPQMWEEYMRKAREMIQKDFSTTRMLAEYQEKLYQL